VQQAVNISLLDTMIIRNIVAALIVTLILTLSKDVSSKTVGQHTGIWAVKFQPSSSKTFKQMAEEFSRQHRLANKGPIGVLRDTYEFVLPDDKIALLHKREVLEQYNLQFSRDSDHVLWSEHQRSLKRFPRGVVFNDPNYNRQWHLVCCVFKQSLIVFNFKEAPLHVRYFKTATRSLAQVTYLYVFSESVLCTVCIASTI